MNFEFNPQFRSLLQSLSLGKRRAADSRWMGTKKAEPFPDSASFFGNEASLSFYLSPGHPKTQQGRAKEDYGGKFRGLSGRFGGRRHDNSRTCPRRTRSTYCTTIPACGVVICGIVPMPRVITCGIVPMPRGIAATADIRRSSSPAAAMPSQGVSLICQRQNQNTSNNQSFHFYLPHRIESPSYSNQWNFQ